jgi:hypothetical protein
VAALRDEQVAVSLEAVHALERRRDQAGMLPMYELVQDEDADPAIRHAAAEALVTLGLLRRRRVGPSRMFLWLVGATLVIVSAAAATSIGIAAIALLPAGVAALIVYSRRASSQERESGIYIGPDGATIHLPPGG